MKRKIIAAFTTILVLSVAGCANESGEKTKTPESGNKEISKTTESGNKEVSKTSESENSPEELFEEAVEDAVFAEESEIEPLVTLTKEDKLVTWDEEGRVLLCTWHNYPDSYPVGEDVTIEWGPVWTFTGKELETYAEELKKAEDPEDRLRQIIAFTPDSEHSTITAFWVNPADVRRPAYQSDPTKADMTTSFGDDVDEEFKKWFDDNTLSSYFYGSYPWTRLGYTYDWADNGTEYGLTEFIVNSGAEVEVEFTEDIDKFLEKLCQ